MILFLIIAKLPGTAVRAHPRDVYGSEGQDTIQDAAMISRTLKSLIVPTEMDWLLPTREPANVN